jgi:Kef-type K+ transport system membrane component KefB
MVDSTIFLQISILLGITISIAFLLRLLKQPLIISYIVAGITAGPALFNIVHEDRVVYDLFAQFGIVLLLFIIGLNLNFRHLKKIGATSFIVAIGQVIFTSGVGAIILLSLGFPWLSSVFIAVAMTFSSTIIILKLLSDKKDTDTVYGKYTIGVMLVQDLIAIIIMVALGMTGGEDVINGSLVLLILKGVMAVAVIYMLAKYLLPVIIHHVAASSEFLFLLTITWCFGVASLLYALGFSLEIGAIAAGISLSASPYQPEIGSRMRPLRDFFLILFFIVLGSQMQIGSLEQVLIPGIVLSLFILIGNPLILYILFRSLKFTRRNSFLSGLTAAQVSEFGFVMLVTGKQTGFISGEEVPVFTIVAIATIFASSYLISYNEQIYRFLLPVFQLFGPDKQRQSTRPPRAYDVWVVGYHRIGKKVCEALKEIGVSFAVIDFDPQSIKELHHKRIPAVFGDIADVEFLGDLPIASAELIVMTIPATDDQMNLIAHAKKSNPDILIIANAYYIEEAKVLYEAGVDYVMMPHAVGASWIADTLKKKKITKESLLALRSKQEVPV